MKEPKHAGEKEKEQKIKKNVRVVLCLPTNPDLVSIGTFGLFFRLFFMLINIFKKL